MKNKTLSIFLVITMLIATLLFVNGEELGKQAEKIFNRENNGYIDVLFENDVVNADEFLLDANKEEKFDNSSVVERNDGQSQSNDVVKTSGGLGIDWSNALFPKFTLTPQTYTFSMPLVFNYDADTGYFVTKYVCENTTDVDLVLKGFEINSENGWYFVSKDYDLKNSLVNARVVKVVVDGQYIEMKNQGYNSFMNEIELPVGSSYTVSISLEFGAFNKRVFENFISFKVYGESVIPAILPLPELEVKFPDILDPGFGIFPSIGQDEDKHIPEIKIPEVLDPGFGFIPKDKEEEKVPEIKDSDKDQETGKDVPDIKIPNVLDPDFGHRHNRDKDRDKWIPEVKQPDILDQNFMFPSKEEEHKEDENKKDEDNSDLETPDDEDSDDNVVPNEDIDTEDNQEQEDSQNHEDNQEQEDNKNTSEDKTSDEVESDKGTDKDNKEDVVIPEIKIPDNLDLKFGFDPSKKKDNKDEQKPEVPEIQIPSVLDPNFGFVPKNDNKDTILPDIRIPSVVDPHFGFIPKEDVKDVEEVPEVPNEDKGIDEENKGLSDDKDVDFEDKVIEEEKGLVEEDKGIEDKKDEDNTENNVIPEIKSSEIEDERAEDNEKAEDLLDNSDVINNDMNTSDVQEETQIRYTEEDFEFLTEDEIANLTDEEMELYLAWLKKKNATMNESNKIIDEKSDIEERKDDEDREPVIEEKEENNNYEFVEDVQDRVVESVEDIQEDVSEAQKENEESFENEEQSDVEEN